MPLDQSGGAASLGALQHIRSILAPAIERTDRSMRLGDLTAAMESRAFGLVLLALALPCCLPFVYLLPQIVALPMLFLCGQMALGRHEPWLPQGLADRTFDAASLDAVAVRATRWFGWVEKIAHTRIAGLSDGLGRRIVGALLAIPSASILIPLPLTNTVPGIGVAIAAFGLVERDGILIVAGLLIGLVWVAALVIGGGAAIALLTETLRGLVP